MTLHPAPACFALLFDTLQMAIRTNPIQSGCAAPDNAKRNITQSIKTVRRMQMLESALVKLQALSREDNFKEAGVGVLWAFFRVVLGVSQISPYGTAFLLRTFFFC